MTDSPTDGSAIPEAKRPMVERALRAAFGVVRADEVRRLTGGLSTALVYRLTVSGNPYVLRVIMNEDAGWEPTRHFANMQAAAEAGIAPRVLYASVADRVSLTDFVEPRPWPPNPSPLVGRTLRRLHSLAPFPQLTTGDYFESMDGFVRRFRAANPLPGAETDELLARYDDMVKVVSRGAEDLVASHNDLKADNMVFDGERVWFIDWEAAFRNDRYLDLSVVANFFVRDPLDEDALLGAYFGEEPGEYRRARFFLMSQTLHVFYTAFLMMMVGHHEPAAPDPTFRAFHDLLLSGAVTLTTAQSKAQYARVHMAEALRNMRTQRFRDALASVGRPGP
jgi:aminoglycoside phosphotransferase (APT) family kinase protein